MSYLPTIRLPPNEAGRFSSHTRNSDCSWSSLHRGADAVLQSMIFDSLAETLDALAMPVLLLGEGARLIHGNRAAERMMKAGEVLRLARGHVAAVHRGADRLLLAAISDSVSGENEQPVAPRAIPLGNGQLGERKIATILSLGPGRNDRGTRPWTGVAALFVQDPDAVTRLPAEGFAELYSITPAELRFLKALAGATSVAEAASALGIAETTGKSHLQSVFLKTGTTRQTDLVGLVMASRAPIKP